MNRTCRSWCPPRTSLVQPSYAAPLGSVKRSDIKFLLPVEFFLYPLATDDVIEHVGHDFQCAPYSSRAVLPREVRNPRWLGNIAPLQLSMNSVLNQFLNADTSRKSVVSVPLFVDKSLIKRKKPSFDSLHSHGSHCTAVLVVSVLAHCVLLGLVRLVCT